MRRKYHEYSVSKPYAYSLYNYNDKFYLIYLTGGPLEYGISIRLNKDEIEMVRDDQTKLEELIREFKSDSSLYEGRRIVPVVTSKEPPSEI
jgi:hypothetical protein